MCHCTRKRLFRTVWLSSCTYISTPGKCRYPSPYRYTTTSTHTTLFSSFDMAKTQKQKQKCVHVQHERPEKREEREQERESKQEDGGRHVRRIRNHRYQDDATLARLIASIDPDQVQDVYRSDEGVDGLRSDLDDDRFDGVDCIDDFDLFYELQDGDGQKALDDDQASAIASQTISTTGPVYATAYQITVATNTAAPSDRRVWKVAQYGVKTSISKGRKNVSA